VGDQNYTRHPWYRPLHVCLLNSMSFPCTLAKQYVYWPCGEGCVAWCVVGNNSNSSAMRTGGLCTGGLGRSGPERRGWLLGGWVAAARPVLRGEPCCHVDGRLCQGPCEAHQPHTGFAIAFFLLAQGSPQGWTHPQCQGIGCFITQTCSVELPDVHVACCGCGLLLCGGCWWGMDATVCGRPSGGLPLLQSRLQPLPPQAVCLSG
jgi:hypothetical protein